MLLLILFGTSQEAPAKKEDDMNQRKSVWSLVLLLSLVLGLFVPYISMAEGEIAAENTEEVGETFEDEIVHPIFEDRVPMAVMINNIIEARPHSGLDKAKLIYEVVVEGGITRFLLVTDETEGVLGSIRSARPAFFELAAEWKSAYSYVGNGEYVAASPLASYIKNLDASNIGGGAYYRTSHRVAPHNLYGSLEGLYNFAEQSLGLDMSLSEPLDQIMISEIPVDRSAAEATLNVEPAIAIDFSYSSDINGIISASSHGYRYDNERGAYLKYTDNIILTEEQTGEIVPVENVIFMKLPHTLMSNGVHWSVAYTSEKDANGQLIPREATLMSGGKAYPLEFTKETPDAPINFTLNGEKLVLDKGLTFIQVLPVDAPLFYEGVASVG